LKKIISLDTKAV